MVNALRVAELSGSLLRSPTKDWSSVYPAKRGLFITRLRNGYILGAVLWKMIPNLGCDFLSCYFEEWLANLKITKVFLYNHIFAKSQARLVGIKRNMGNSFLWHFSHHHHHHHCLHCQTMIIAGLWNHGKKSRLSLCNGHRVVKVFGLFLEGHMHKHSTHWWQFVTRWCIIIATLLQGMKGKSQDVINKCAPPETRPSPQQPPSLPW